ncbi:hypothetical protein ACVWXN_004905 [Bradyrhizobium sp. i1.4.4]
MVSSDHAFATWLISAVNPSLVDVANQEVEPAGKLCAGAVDQLLDGAIERFVARIHARFAFQYCTAGRTELDNLAASEQDLSAADPREHPAQAVLLGVLGVRVSR